MIEIQTRDRLVIREDVAAAVDAAGARLDLSLKLCSRLPAECCPLGPAPSTIDGSARLKAC